MEYYTSPVHWYQVEEESYKFGVKNWKVKVIVDQLSIGMPCHTEPLFRLQCYMFDCSQRFPRRYKPGQPPGYGWQAGCVVCRAAARSVERQTSLLRPVQAEEPHLPEGQSVHWICSTWCSGIHGFPPWWTTWGLFIKLTLSTHVMSFKFCVDLCFISAIFAMFFKITLQSLCMDMALVQMVVVCNIGFVLLGCGNCNTVNIEIFAWRLIFIFSQSSIHCENFPQKEITTTQVWRKNIRKAIHIILNHGKTETIGNILVTHHKISYQQKQRS